MVVAKNCTIGLLRTPATTFLNTTIVAWIFCTKLLYNRLYNAVVQSRCTESAYFRVKSLYRLYNASVQAVYSWILGLKNWYYMRVSNCNFNLNLPLLTIHMYACLLSIVIVNVIIINNAKIDIVNCYSYCEYMYDLCYR